MPLLGARTSVIAAFGCRTVRAHSMRPASIAAGSRRQGTAICWASANSVLHWRRREGDRQCLEAAHEVRGAAGQRLVGAELDVGKPAKEFVEHGPDFETGQR